MPHFHQLVRWCWMPVLMTAAVACFFPTDDSIPPPSGHATDVWITSPSLEGATYVQVGDTMRLTAVAVDAAGFEVESTDSVVRTWKLSPSGLAGLEPQPPSAREVLVRGLTPGSGTVTATVKALNVSGTSDLTVLPRLRSVELEPAVTQLVVGDSVFISAVITDTAGHQLSGLYPEWLFGDARIAAFRDIGVPGGLRLYGLAPGTYVLGARIAHFTGVPATIQVMQGP